MPPKAVKRKSVAEVARTTSGMSLRDSNNRRPPASFTPEPHAKKGSKGTKGKGKDDPPPPPPPQVPSTVDPPAKRVDAVQKGNTTAKGSKKTGTKKRTLSDLAESTETLEPPKKTVEMEVEPPANNTKKKKSIQLQLRRSPRGGKTNISVVNPLSIKYPTRSVGSVEKEPVNRRLEPDEFSDEEEDWLLDNGDGGAPEADGNGVTIGNEGEQEEESEEDPSEEEEEEPNEEEEEQNEEEEPETNGEGDNSDEQGSEEDPNEEEEEGNEEGDQEEILTVPEEEDPAKALSIRCKWSAETARTGI